MRVKFKKMIKDAPTPKYSRIGDGAIDLVAMHVLATMDYIEYDTGLAFQLPLDYIGLIMPRSSVSQKDLVLCNGVGLLDENYSGSVKLRFKLSNRGTKTSKVYEIGDRVGQLLIIPRPVIVLDEVEELGVTNRGISGFGSSGR